MKLGLPLYHPSKVIAQIGRRNVPSVTSADKGKTHTLLACVSASGLVIAPFMVYPRKQPVPKKLREGGISKHGISCERQWLDNEIPVL